MNLAHEKCQFHLEENNQQMNETLSRMGVMLANNAPHTNLMEHIETGHESQAYVPPLTAKFFYCHTKEQQCPLYFAVNWDDKRNEKELGKKVKDIDMECFWSTHETNRYPGFHNHDGHSSM
jgi:hypothetical protein